MKRILINKKNIENSGCFITLRGLIDAPIEFVVNFIKDFGLADCLNGVPIENVYKNARFNYFKFATWLKEKYNITEEDTYCCEQFESIFRINYTLNISKSPFNYYFITSPQIPDTLIITHCPFCGKKL